jgi:precorrin-6Y C5,15-methyltransferase (decarboxylating)
MVVVAYLVTVVGVGPGSREYLLPAAAEAVNEADLLVGGKTALALFAPLKKEHLLLGSDLKGALDYVAEARKTKRVAVLLSGDPGFFSFLPRLKQRFGMENLRVIPGVSSLQLACARIGLQWQDLCCISVHGRDLSRLDAVGNASKVAVLTDNRYSPAVVCRYFLEQGANFSTVWVFTNLGQPDELITQTDLAAGAQLVDRGNSIVILLKDEAAAVREPLDDGWVSVVTPGLPNSLFLQGDVAISQEEVRALVLCKARLRRGMVVYEIGAGSGSWTVELARLISPGRVYAVEKNPEAVELVRANLKKFGLNNAEVAAGEAPAACAGFPQADCVLVGGSGGRLEEVISAAQNWLRPGGTLLLSAVTPDTFSTAWQQLQGAGWEQQEAVLLHLSRVAPRGRARIWQGENPVFLLQARYTGGEDSNE